MVAFWRPACGSPMGSGCRLGSRNPAPGCPLAQLMVMNAGMVLLMGSASLFTQPPADGWVMDARWVYPVRMKYLPGPWAPWVVFMERMMDSLLAWRARLGRYSLSWIPSALVLIAFLFPWMVGSAWGLGSKVSRCVMPPDM